MNITGEHYRVKDARLTPPPFSASIPLYIGGFTDKALERVVSHADGYFGNEEIWDLYAAKLKEHGKDSTLAAIRIPGLFLTVAEDPERAMAELAPYYHHIYNCYGAWMNEDNALGLDRTMDPMDVEGFKRSGILQILTPEQAVTYFKTLKQRMPVDHYMMARPPGLPAARFVEYAELFADKVIPAVN